MLVCDHVVGVVLHTVLPLERTERSGCINLSERSMIEDRL